MAKKIPVSAYIPALRKRMGQGYVYGTTGQTCTVTLLKKKNAQYGKKMKSGYYQLKGDYTRGLCARWLNRWVADCVGLLKGTSRDLGGFYRDVSADGLYRLCNVKGPISQMPHVPGVLLFCNDGGGSVYKHMHHTGIYTGRGLAEQSAGVLTGIIEGKMSRGWTHYGILTDWFVYDLPDEGTGEIIDPDAPGYHGDGSSGQADDPVIDTDNVPWLKKGNKGESVKYLQEQLMKHGYALPKSTLKTGKLDGDFGRETDTAVRKFQTANHLEVDGVAGPATWSALLGVVCH